MSEAAAVIEETATSTTEGELTRAEQAGPIIKNHMYMAAGLGVVPVPLVDLVGFMAVQYDMTKKIAGIYQVEFSKERVRSIVLSLLGSVLPVALTHTTASLLKFVPVLGTFATALSVSTLGTASTYAIGKVLVQHFETGGTLLDFDAVKMRDYFKQQFEVGKKAAKTTK
ncbi:hypothetical protein JCM30471_29410 [Desulfuromonas carbonis]|uniref:YcjF family protein n=1 Tax=Desulfuromonas sp. DDH964 TaxID=1823759 RepID=UPI00078EE48D|nr:DUF697 domain-containing protein [Desulfuromonas sp. DDH964]AMV71120.1 hypothetical protein DBW_0735 [Desulfuromonas sp. DDH964]